MMVLMYINIISLQDPERFPFHMKHTRTTHTEFLVLKRNVT